MEARSRLRLQEMKAEAPAKTEAPAKRQNTGTVVPERSPSSRPGFGYTFSWNGYLKESYSFSDDATDDDATDDDDSDIPVFADLGTDAILPCTCPKCMRARSAQREETEAHPAKRQKTKVSYSFNDDADAEDSE